MARTTTITIPAKVVSTPTITRKEGSITVTEAWPSSTHKGWPTSTQHKGGTGAPKTPTGIPRTPGTSTGTPRSGIRQSPIGAGKTGIFHASTGAHIGTVHHNPVTMKATHTTSHITGTSVKGKNIGFVKRSAGIKIK